MDGADFRRRIVQAFSFLDKEFDIVRTVSSLVSLPVNTEYNKIALKALSTYGEIYRSAVSLSQYNLMLSDYAVFQFSWEDVDSWRLAYLPNPWLSGSENIQSELENWEMLESLGSLGYEEVTSLIGDLPYHGEIPTIRFEYSSSQYREIAHPLAHLHIGRHTENRWALARPLDPLTFTMIIIKLYYSNIWSEKSSFWKSNAGTCLDKKLIDELSKSSLCSMFTDYEKQSFHFTSQSSILSTANKEKPKFQKLNAASSKALVGRRKKTN